MNTFRAMSRVLVAVAVVVMNQSGAMDKKFTTYCKDNSAFATFTLLANKSCEKNEHGQKALMIGAISGLSSANDESTAKSIVVTGVTKAAESYVSTRVLAEANNRGYDRKWLKSYLPAAAESAVDFVADSGLVESGLTLVCDAVVSSGIAAATASKE